MSQEINLFNPAFRKQRLVLSLVTVGECLAVTLLTLFAFHFYFQQQLKGLNEELASAQNLLKAQRAYSERLRGEGAKRQADDVLEAEIARLEAELKGARASLDALKGGALGNQQGFAEYLRAFSRQSLNGLWLTGFSITGGDIALQGRVLSPDLVPSYLQRLNQEKVFQGRAFAALDLRQPRPVEPAAGKDEKAPRSAPYLEFNLSTAEPAAAARSEAKP
jgi:hypothetical protein